MRMVIDLPENLIRKIRDLFAKKNYSDLNAFLIAAVENQLHMEEDPLAETISPAISGEEIRAEKLLIKKGGMKPDLKILKYEKAYEDLPCIKSPSENQIYQSKDVIGATGQLWGQINRIFPIKVTLRVLSSQLLEGKKLKPEDIRQLAAESARELGLFMRARISDEQKCNCVVGLPIGDEEKSKSRFMNHFVLIDKSGLLDGAMAKLRFIGLDENGFVQLTKAGLKFNNLKNPVLDFVLGTDQKKQGECLSDEERSFLIQHLKEILPGEFGAIQWLLNTIDRGNDSRKAMERELKTKYKDWTYAVVATQHMGLVSRCCELGLIIKDKIGKEVKYVLTAQGKKIVSK